MTTITQRAKASEERYRTLYAQANALILPAALSSSERPQELLARTRSAMEDIQRQYGVDPTDPEAVVAFERSLGLSSLPCSLKTHQ